MSGPIQISVAPDTDMKEVFDGFFAAKKEQDAREGLNQSGWPAPMEAEAFHGVAGDFVRLVEPETEADPAALLANFLVGASALFDGSAYTIADGRKHAANEFLLTAGDSGTGRKGTATGRVRPLLEATEAEFGKRILSGLSSGEGLIKGLTPTEGEPDATRRFLVVLPEFATLLGVMRREGNTMSAILREAFDGERLRVMTRKEPLCVDGVKLSVIAHVTPSELLNGLTETDRVNGFANRFLLLCVRRSKLLPEGGADVNLSAIVTRLHEAVERAKNRGRLYRDEAAKASWEREYPHLTCAREGLRGALLSRGETHVLRLSLLYALLDCDSAIREPHLRAALAFWRYCEASVGYLFAEATGDPAKDKILSALADGPLTKEDLHAVFARNKTAEWIALKMQEIVRAGIVEECQVEGSRGRKVQAWQKIVKLRTS